MLEIKRFRWVHRLLKRILGVIGFFLGARTFFLIENVWMVSLLSFAFGLALSVTLGGSYRFLFPDGVPANDVTDIIDNQSYNKVGLQLVYAFLKGVGALLVALALLWLASLTV